MIAGLEIFTDNLGNEWITGKVLCKTGDSVNEANIRYLQNKGNIVELDYDKINIYNKEKEIYFSNGKSADFSVVFYRNQAFVKISGSQVDQDLVKETMELEDYPSYNDELISEVECEWESDAWENCVKADLIEYLQEEFVDYIEEVMFPVDKNIPNDKIREENIDSFYFEAYRETMDTTNSYPTYENNGAFIDINKIQETFKKCIREKVVEYRNSLNIIPAHIPTKSIRMK